MEGGSQAQDHGQAIYAKILYSISSTFAAGSSFKSCNSSISNCVFWRVESIPLKRNPKFLWEAKGKIKINNSLWDIERREGRPEIKQSMAKLQNTLLFYISLTVERQ